MNGRTVALLAGLGVLALAGGWYFGTATTPAEHTAIAAGQLMFPDLTPKLAGATRVVITHQGKQTVIEKRPDGIWGVASMHDYPAQQTKLHALFTAMTELRLAEPRTADPSEFSRLGVDDPNAAGSSADLLQVMDTAGKPIAALIAGHRRVRSQGEGPDEIYVRRPGENQSWLARGNLQVEADPASWLDRDIMNISHDRIASVVVGDQALVFGKAGGKFTLIQPADHPKLEDYKVDDVGRALELLTLESVEPDSALTSPETTHAVFTTTDGLAITAHVFHVDKDHVWVRFTVAATSDKAKQEADRMNARMAGWTYQVGAWKQQSLAPTLDDLKAEQPAADTSKK